LGQEEKFNIDRFLPMHGVFVRKGRDFHIERWLVDDLQKERTRFFLKIQDGCNKFCSYCVVPYARGAVRSRPSEEIIATMKLLVERGVKEVVLTGIDLAAYCDPLSGSDLKALLLLLENTEETPPRIRLSSVDPEYLDDEFIGILGDCGKLAKSLHIPVQSGSERILKSMGRRYSPSLINEIVGKLKDRIGRIGIGMDVMVGFPGEDEAAFAETYGFIEQLGVSYLHIFPFSEREGTKACAMEHKVPESIKRSRVRKLKAIDAKKRQAFSSLLIGSTVWVIPEARIYHNGHMRGYSDNYVPVYMPYEKSLENNLVEVTIKEMQGVKLIGGR
jgi:threonylcarbamoyladenosine tRNA methylthiotransferase MtaB